MLGAFSDEYKDIILSNKYSILTHLLLTAINWSFAQGDRFSDFRTMQMIR